MAISLVATKIPATKINENITNTAKIRDFFALT
jgi:hypothetical protein